MSTLIDAPRQKKADWAGPVSLGLAQRSGVGDAAARPMLVVVVCVHPAG